MHLSSVALDNNRQRLQLVCGGGCLFGIYMHSQKKQKETNRLKHVFTRTISKAAIRCVCVDYRGVRNYIHINHHVNPTFILQTNSKDAVFHNQSRYRHIQHINPKMDPDLSDIVSHCG